MDKIWKHTGGLQTQTSVSLEQDQNTEWAKSSTRLSSKTERTRQDLGSCQERELEGSKQDKSLESGHSLKPKPIFPKESGKNGNWPFTDASRVRPRVLPGQAPLSCSPAQAGQLITLQ